MRYIFLSILSCLPFFAGAQVPKKVIAEHFTNTYCSICASRNPGFYSNLSQFPQVLHIAYHPSAPYAACPLNQQNKQENDSRTNFYGIYGSTPYVVIQGTVVSGSLNDPAIFNAALGQTSPFELKVSMIALSGDNASVAVVLKKVAATATTSLQLYTVIVEDTLSFNANNGETTHHDVFRRSVWGSPINVTMPAGIGDSIVQTKTININSVWQVNQLYAIAIVQDANKEVVQAERSDRLSASLSVNATGNDTRLMLYPNPAQDKLFITGYKGNNCDVVITDLTGTTLKKETVTKHIDISSLSKGMYFAIVQNGDDVQVLKFVKQ